MKPNTMPEVGLIREGDLLRTGAVPFGRTTLREMVAAGQFPAPLDLGPRLKPFDVAEVRAWLAQRTATAPRVARITPSARGGA